MTKIYLLGLDIAQTGAMAQLARPDGTRCWRRSLSTDQAGWKELTHLVHREGLRFSQLRVLVEATGIYHFAWVERLHAEGAEVYVVNPLLASRLESTANALRSHKTDRVDVERLCEIGRLYLDSLARFRYQPDPARQGLKQLSAARATLRAQLTNLKKALGSQLELVFPALRAAAIDPCSERGAAILQRAATAGTWRAVPAKRRRELAGDAADALDRACKQTLADERLALACGPALRALLAAVLALAEQLASCDRQIAPQLPTHCVQLLTSIPGVGERTAAVLAAYLPEDCASWGAAKVVTARLQALFGCDPRLRQSGKWNGKVKISKRGIGAARTALFQCAFCSIVHDPENSAYYDQLRQRGKSHKQAIVDLMRKQLRRIVAVLRSNRPFVVQYHAAA
jgi:transposase